MRGIYVLIIKLEKDRRIQVGALGPVQFKRGMYAYIGSAQNSVEKRITRHLRSDKKMHWHIDYLLKKARIRSVYIIPKDRDFECFTAKNADGIPIPRFGCSDCSCPSHLIKIKGIEQFIKMGFSKYIS